VRLLYQEYAGRRDALPGRRPQRVRARAPGTRLGSFLKAMADQHNGTFAVGFADAWSLPPNARFREKTDR